jgi:hypothetical protein
VAVLAVAGGALYLLSGSSLSHVRAEWRGG